MNTKFKVVCNKCGSDNVIIDGDYDKGYNKDGSWFDEIRNSYWCTVRCLDCGEHYCALDDEK